MASFSNSSSIIYFYFFKINLFEVPFKIAYFNNMSQNCFAMNLHIKTTNLSTKEWSMLILQYFIFLCQSVALATVIGYYIFRIEV